MSGISPPPLDTAAITTDLIPDGDNTRSLGSTLKTWATLFIRTLKSNVADGASAVGHIFDTVNGLANATAKLASFKNATVEKLYVTKDGYLQVPSGSTFFADTAGASTGSLLLQTGLAQLSRGGSALNVESGLSKFLSCRLTSPQGAAVASANDLTLGLDGNLFAITGTTTINGIAIASWQAGSFITLKFSDALTVKHNTAAGAGFARLSLAGGVDFLPVAGNSLSLVYDGTYWQEVSRALTVL
jgi:hypothetical protein